MVLGRRRWIFVAIPLILMMVLTACERPLASNESETAEEAAEATAVADTAQEDVAGEEQADDSTEDSEGETAEAEDEMAEGAAAEEVAAEETEADSESDTVDETESESETVEEAESSDPDVGGGTPDTVADEEAAVGEDVDTDEASGEEAAEEDTAADEATIDEASDASEESQESEVADEASDSESMTEDADAAVDEGATEGEESTTEQDATMESSTLPATHTVAPGENLYRIGLQYGMSWVTLAAYNHLPNANYIRVGQVLRIPGGSTPSPVPPPAEPDEPGYTDYVVQLGDTLNSIARKYGVSWVEIAEANGIVNPNLIYAGQVLKIPTSQPEAPPSVTHTVQPGETLYRISLQYGVHWLAIAQANQITPPYVIYPGQVLVIPGG